MTQANDILAYLQTGASITPLDALDRYGCFRLAARINDLRGQGYEIETTTVRDRRTGKQYAAYRLAGKQMEMAV